MTSFLGMASTSSTVFGTLYAASRVLAKSMMSAGAGAIGGIDGLDDGVHPAAPLGIPQADDDDVGDRRMLAERGLDLCRKDIDAPGHDHVDVAGRPRRGTPSSSSQPMSPTVTNPSSVDRIGSTFPPMYVASGPAGRRM